MDINIAFSMLRQKKKKKKWYVDMDRWAKKSHAKSELAGLRYIFATELM